MCRWKKTRSNLSTTLTCGCHDTEDAELQLSHFRVRPRILAIMDGQPFAHPATEVVLDIMRRTSRIVAVARGANNTLHVICVCRSAGRRECGGESEKFPGWSLCVSKEVVPESPVSPLESEQVVDSRAYKHTSFSFKPGFV